MISVGQAAALLGLGIALLGAQRQEPKEPTAGLHGAPQSQKITSRTELVVVDVVALDKNRKPVTDLREGDIRVSEDGHQRKLSAFSVVDVRSEVGTEAQGQDEPRPTSAGVGMPLDSVDEGRLVLIVFDRTIPFEAMPVAQSIARRVVQELGPRDFAAVLRTTSFANNGVTTNLTQDRNRLLAAIASPSMGLTTPPNMTPLGLRETNITDTNPGECLCGACVFDRIGDIASQVAIAPRLRKIMFLIASDMPDEAGNFLQCGAIVRPARARLYRQLDLANLTVHVLDPLELETHSVNAGALPGSTANASRLFGLQRRNRLAELPDRTGGRLVVDRNQSMEAVGPALNESSVYYLVGFEPMAPPDGKDHRIEVRVRDSRVEVLKWRRSYRAAEPVQ